MFYWFLYVFVIKTLVSAVFFSLCSYVRSVLIKKSIHIYLCVCVCVLIYQCL